MWHKTAPAFHTLLSNYFSASERSAPRLTRHYVAFAGQTQTRRCGSPLPRRSAAINKHSWSKQLREENQSCLWRCVRSMEDDGVKHLGAALLVAAGATRWINSLSGTAGVNTAHTLLLPCRLGFQAALTTHMQVMRVIWLFLPCFHTRVREKDKKNKSELH